MRKFLLCAIAATGSLLPLQARQLTPTQALSRALGSDIPGVTLPSRGASAPVLVYTATEPSTGDNGVYVFNRADGEGYLIVSADDATPALLGYADEGLFSLKDMPDGLRYMIQEYASQVAWASQNLTPSRAVAERPARAAIAPMVTTLWNQSAPYNDLCPLDTISKRSVTGCVATAMAQILKYHNYPAKGTGSNSYTPKGVGKTVSFDFGNTTFQWDKMLDSYTSSATDEQKTAVATLMLACGVSVNMDYTSDESGASPYAPAPAFINYFGYDKTAAYQSRDLYGILDWEALIYDNLTNCGPVLLDGQSGTGGHEFVCDGYSTDGYFHINWGWGGMSNGYFLLTALDPGSQGIGGSAGGYNFSQGAVTGIRPPVAGSTAPLTMVSQIDLTGRASGSDIILEGEFVNMSSVTLNNLKLGVEINGNYYPSVYETNNLAPNYLTKNIIAPIKGLPAGTYDVYPAYKCDGQDWTRMKAPIMSVDHIVLTANGDGTYTVAQPEAAYSLDITDMKLGTPLSPGKKFSLTALATNSGTAEFYSTIVLALINSDNEAAELTEYSLDVLPGGSTPMEVVQTLPNVPVGNYTMYFCYANENGITPIGNGLPVTVETSVTPVLGVTGCVIENANNVDLSNIKITATVNNTGGYYFGPLRVAVFPLVYNQEVSSVTEFSSADVMLPAGQQTTVNITGSYPEGTIGNSYFIIIYAGSTKISNTYEFTAGVKTGIDTVGNDVQPTGISIYTPAGMAVTVPADVTDIESLRGASIPAGLYIVVETFADGSVKTTKIRK